MSYSIEFGPDGSPNRTIDAGTLTRIDVAKPHTALCDFEVEIPYDRQIKDQATERVRVYADDTVLFRGYLRDLNWNQGRGQTILSGPGIGQDLKDEGIEVTFTNTTYHAAIADVWANHTGFDATVRDPQVSTIVTDDILVDVLDADAWADLVTVSDTVPLDIHDFDGDGNDELGLLQSAYHQEVEDMGPFNTAATGNDSEGAAGSFFDSSHGVSDSITVDYTIPQEYVGLAARTKHPDDPDGDGSFEGPKTTISVAGDAAIQLGSDSIVFETGSDAYTWRTNESFASSDLSAGSHSVDIDIDSNDGRILVDLIVVYDTRFSYTFDNNVDANDHLAGPELYPDAFTLTFDQQSPPWNVTEIGIASTWNDTSGDQAIATSADGGSTWTSHANTSSVEDAYTNNTGSTVDVRATFSRYGSGNNATPTQGHQGQYIEAWETDYDGTDLPIIDGRTFRGSPFQVLQQMHREADYRWAIDHAATDGSGNLVKRVESFQTGTQSQSKSWTVKNRNPSLSYSDYANQVTIWGAEQDDGTRPVATVRDQSEINSEGEVEAFSDTRPELDTLDGVKGFARAILRKKLDGKTQKGSLEVLPTDALPGYDYPVDWFDDGNSVDSPLERVTFSESADQMRGNLKFTVDKDTAATVVAQSFELTSTKQSI